MTTQRRLYFFIGFSLFAFAANSILCRLALADDLIAPASFTLWRLASGALTLALLCVFYRVRNKTTNMHCVWLEGSWLSSFVLFIYALSFSYAYVSLSAGLGALVLFGAVQLTLILLALCSAQRLSWLEWLGLGIAFTGFVYLLYPSLQETRLSLSSSFAGLLLMSLSGMAWGLYTWRGKRSARPVFATASNFMRTTPMLLILLLFTLFEHPSSGNGILLAILSGSIMSGLGYGFWYGVLPSIRTSTAAVLQLLVPLLAALGGVIFAHEAVTTHLVFAMFGVLGGVLLVILGKK